ncbi:type II toxin-antitoxin system Phd/YefM family antitoxin [Sphingomonas sp.]|uniref:type II toxin-antitoxin system Phd/YefM family antitoxin n=1 Tax=Sphingomonas sp. TaxID=28214 RepID=UPI003CC6856A
MQTVSYTEARENLKAMIDKVNVDRAPIAITRQRGSGGAVLISQEEWASIEETLYLLKSPRNADRLLEAVRGFEAGGEQAVPLP